MLNVCLICVCVHFYNVVMCIKEREREREREKKVGAKDGDSAGTLVYNKG